MGMYITNKMYDSSAYIQKQVRYIAYLLCKIEQNLQLMSVVVMTKYVVLWSTLPLSV